MLYDIGDRAWSAELAELFGVPLRALPEVRPSSGRYGTSAEGMGVPTGTPISGIAGDQQAALFGQACLEPGMTKNTYGTGSFVLMNVGPTVPPPVDGLLTSVAWELADGSIAYALEGSIFITGAAVQWLRDGLQLITEASETEALAASVPDSGGVVVVPAFAGLGSPYWDPYARGTMIGITRGVTAAHVTRAVVESMAFQTRDVVDAMTAAASHPVSELRVDGGASTMDLLLQFQADQLGVTVRRPRNQETTAAGAAYLAGLAEGVWASTDDVSRAWQVESTFEPASDRTAADATYAQWRRAVERSRRWAVS
jgi:glycerol kinase